MFCFEVQVEPIAGEGGGETYPAWMVVLTVAAAGLVVVIGIAMVVHTHRHAVREDGRVAAQRQARIQSYRRQQAQQKTGATNGLNAITTTAQKGRGTASQIITASRGAVTTSTTIRHGQRTGQGTGHAAVNTAQPRPRANQRKDTKNHSKRYHKGKSHQAGKVQQGGTQQASSAYIDMSYEGTMV